MLTIFVYFILPTILLILGLPIFLVLLVTCLVAVLFVADVPTEAIQTYLFGSLDSFPLLAVPFFILAGEIMAQAELALGIDIDFRKVRDDWSTLTIQELASELWNQPSGGGQ